MTAPATAEAIARIASRNRGGDYAPDWELAITGYDELRGYAGSLMPVSDAIPSVDDYWVHIAGVFNGTKLTAYANGKKVLEAPIAAVKDSDNKLAFGAKDRTMVRGHFTGLFDEFRLRDAVSTADWVKAEYDQSEATFLISDGAKAASR